MKGENKPTTGIANINGAQLYYEVSGDGYPLVLLHAGVADSRMWDEQIDVFSQFYWVIRFDMRGFGRSSMPPGSFSNIEDVRGLLDYLQVDEACLLGLSFGGLVALDFTLAYPENVKALILGAPSISGDEPSERIKQFWDDEEAALENDDLEAATELNLRLWVDGPHRRPDQVSSPVRERVREMQHRIFELPVPDDVEEIPLTPSAVKRLGEVKVPTLVIVGELDLEEKIVLADRLVAEMPNAQKEMVPNAAHIVNMEKPDEFNRMVLEFLAGL